jgi:hypothetical protein
MPKSEVVVELPSSTTTFLLREYNSLSGSYPFYTKISILSLLLRISTMCRFNPPKSLARPLSRPLGFRSSRGDVNFCNLFYFLYRPMKVETLILSHETDRITVRATAEAVKKLLSCRHGKGWRFFGMKGTECDPFVRISASLFQAAAKIVADDVKNIYPRQ